MSGDSTKDFAGVKQRLEQIAEAVNDDALPLDDALDLYEEAVALGMQISDLLELGIDEEEAPGDDVASPAADDVNDAAPPVD